MSRSSSFRPVAVLVFAVLSVGAMALRNHSEPSTTTTTTTVITNPSSSATITDTSHSDTAQVTVTGPADQVKLFGALPKPPEGAHKWAGNGPEGILTTEQFIEADYKTSGWAEERVALPKRGYQYSVRVDWCTLAESCVDVFIDHFATPTQAESYYRSQTNADAKDYDAHGTVTVPGVPDSKVFAKTELNSDGDAELNGMAHVGSNVTRLDMLTPATPDQATLIDLMTVECNALKGMPS